MVYTFFCIIFLLINNIPFFVKKKKSKMLNTRVFIQARLSSVREHVSPALTIV